MPLPHPGCLVAIPRALPRMKLWRIFPVRFPTIQVSRLNLLKAKHFKKLMSRCQSMPELPGVNHFNAVRALEKAGYWVARQGKHIVMTDGSRIITIPRRNPVNAITMGAFNPCFYCCCSPRSSCFNPNCQAQRLSCVNVLSTHLPLRMHPHSLLALCHLQSCTAPGYRRPAGE